MSERDVNDALIEVSRALGFVATHSDDSIRDHFEANAFRAAGNGGTFRRPTKAVAYLQAPTGWRQRVHLTVLLRVDHPLAAVVPRFADEPAPPPSLSYRPPRLPEGRATDALIENLSILASSGMPVVIEKCIADRLPVDALSPSIVGPDGVQVLQRQTLRVWNTLALWMREYTRSPRGTQSPFRGESSDQILPDAVGAEPILL